MKIEHRFVEFIPESIESGVLYVSITYATAMHLCVCGCGKEVVTPFSPTDWKLVFDGETVSLTPSIGNWSFLCRSHYFIKRNRVEWAGDMSRAAIENNRRYDHQLKAQQYTTVDTSASSVKTTTDSVERLATKKLGLYEVVKSFFKTDGRN